MAGERSYMRIPPDSSGKRIALNHSAQINYENKPPSYIWTPNTFYTTSDNIDIFIFEIYESTSTTGILNVRYSQSAESSNQTPAIGSTINEPVSNTQVATVVGVRDVWFNVGNITGSSNPSYGLEVDNTGSASIRFDEGRPQLDAFGKLRVSGATHLGQYIYSDSKILDEFAKTTENGGSITYDANDKAVIIATSPNNGALSRFTSHTYHHYNPGASHLFMGTATLADPAATGAIRQWGLLDEFNGYAFTINEFGQFGVTIRSSVGGTILETFIPQSEFSEDRVDGSKDNNNLSTMDLDLTKDNIYWIDVQWHGAGRARFGVFYNGQRVTVHEYNHSNRYTYSMTQTVSLPVSYTIDNISSAVPLQIKTWSASVWTEHSLDVTTLGINAGYSSQAYTITAGPNDPLQALFAISPVVEVESGFVNRRFYMPTNINAVAYNPTSGEEALVEVHISQEPTATDLTWVTEPSTNMQISDSLTTFDRGRSAFNRVFKGVIEADTTTIYNNLQYGAISNYADNGGTGTNNITNITQASPAVITVSERWNLREASGALTIAGVNGMISVNNNQYYLNITGTNTAELYLDEARTQPLDSTLFAAYTSGGTIFGNFGTRQIYVVAAKNLVAGANTSMILTINWKEIPQ